MSTPTDNPPQKTTEEEFGPVTPENSPVPFSYHWYVKAVAVVDILVFLGCGLLTIFKIWGDGNLLSAVGFPGLALLGIGLLLWASRSYTVQEDGILSHAWYGSEESHAWGEMETVEGMGFGSGIRIRSAEPSFPWTLGSPGTTVWSNSSGGISRRCSKRKARP